MRISALLLYLIVFDRLAAQELKPARPFADHMVLPMERPVPIWGKARPTAVVEVRFAGRKWETVGDACGNWRMELPSLAASKEGRLLEIVSGEEKRELANVLVGRVWMCSGQSNMDFSLAKATGGPAAAQKAGEFPQIRLFNMTSAPTGAGKYDEATLRNLAQEESGVGSWQVASPEAAGEISAIAWWMAVELQQKEGVPVGIVENAVGGSPTEAWIPRETLESRPDYRPLLAENWLECEKLSAWARSRARQNLGSHLQANHPFRPGFLFESQVRPWVNFPFDGICWYQGETNAEINDAAWHRRVLSDFIGGWRKAAQRPTLPFYMVQLPRIGGKDPLRKFWPEYRQVQATVVKSLAGVHLVVTEDLGYDSPDVHPPDKRPVAQRLASGIQNAQEQRAEKRSE